jgi:uncharacterized membrane protein
LNSITSLTEEQLQAGYVTTLLNIDNGSALEATAAANRPSISVNIVMFLSEQCIASKQIDSRRHRGFVCLVFPGNFKQVYVETLFLF